MPHFKAWALWCAGRGYRVFPLREGDKRPAIKSFPALATTDAATIEHWWTENENYNIGVCTTNFVVVDLDTAKHNDALEAFELLGGDPFKTFTVRTPSGGMHCYYDGGDYSNSASDIALGVDVRSHHGYVVGPGSVTPKGEYSILADMPRAAVPGPVRALLKPPPALRTREDLGQRDTPASIQQAIDYAATAPPAIEGQGGDDHTFKVAARVVRDYGLTPEAAFGVLLDHWNPRCSPPWDANELWPKLEHADAYGQNDIGRLSASQHFEGINVANLPKPSVFMPAAAPHIVSGIHLGNLPEPSEIKPRPWLAIDLLMRRQVSMLVGSGAAGKSMFELTCAAHFVQGKDFGPFRLREGKPCRVMMYNSEDDLDEQGRRLWAVCAVYGFDYHAVKNGIIGMDASQSDLILANNNNETVQMVQGNVDFVEQLARENAIDIMMFDPMLNIHTLPENDNSLMRHFLTQVRGIAHRTNTAIMIAHHTNKGGGREADDPGNFRGASSIVDTPRIALSLSSGDGPNAEKQKEMSAFGATPRKGKKYMRIDNAKSNYGPKTGEALMWFEWKTARTPAHDIIGVPSPFDAVLRETSEFNQFELTVRDMVFDAMRERGVGSMAMIEVMGVLKSKGLIDEAAKNSTVARRPVERALNNTQHKGVTFSVERSSGSVLIVMK